MNEAEETNRAELAISLLWPLSGLYTELLSIPRSPLDPIPRPPLDPHPQISPRYHSGHFLESTSPADLIFQPPPLDTIAV